MNAAAAIGKERVYLASYLAPLASLLARDDITDIHVNQPYEAWVETLGGITERHDIPALDQANLLRLARQIAAFSHQGISREHPLLSAILPDGARVQVAAPPATRSGVVLSIRKHIAADMSLADYADARAFTGTRTQTVESAYAPQAELRRLLDTGEIASALKLAVVSQFNILVSGGTSTGKTTFLNALIREVPAEERLVLIEDTPELHIDRPNAIGLLAARSALGEAAVEADDLVAASLRMRPDRILIGELRGREAMAFLRAINTGHPGSMTTVHANSPSSAVEQIALLVLQSGSQLSRSDVKEYVRSTIDVYVHLDRISGRRVVTAVTCKLD